MEMDHKREKGILTLSLEGQLDESSAPNFEKRLFDFLHAGEKTVVLDLKDLDHLSQDGLMVLLKAAKLCKERNGQIFLCGLRDRVLEVFEVSGVLRLFSIHPSVEDALTAFS